jgi:hypothetical protein
LFLAFTCKGRHFCPACHQRRVRQSADWIATSVCHEVPHRQFVFTIPKILRGIFRWCVIGSLVDWSLVRLGIHLTSKASTPKESAARRFFKRILGNAGRIGIFALEEFPHESGSKPLSLAQIRRLEVPFSLFSPKHRPSETPKHLFQSPRSPATPISPPSGPATGSSNGLHPESNFLAFCGPLILPPRSSPSSSS